MFVHCTVFYLVIFSTCKCYGAFVQPIYDVLFVLIFFPPVNVMECLCGQSMVWQKLGRQNTLSRTKSKNWKVKVAIFIRSSKHLSGNTCQKLWKLNKWKFQFISETSETKRWIESNEIVHCPKSKNSRVKVAIYVGQNNFILDSKTWLKKQNFEVDNLPMCWNFVPLKHTNIGLLLQLDFLTTLHLDFYWIVFHWNLFWIGILL